MDIYRSDIRVIHLLKVILFSIRPRKPLYLNCFDVEMKGAWLRISGIF
tara:strand:- start:5741 stop:5884 length:144 start_codon:yes stop_codon:yes gene_type:complete